MKINSDQNFSAIISALTVIFFLVCCCIGVLIVRQQHEIQRTQLGRTNEVLSSYGGDLRVEGRHQESSWLFSRILGSCIYVDKWLHLVS